MLIILSEPQTPLIVHFHHFRLEKIVSIMLFGKPNANPNATAAKNALPGTVPGSTPPILLAATRGYYKVSDGWVPYVLFVLLDLFIRVTIFF